MAGDPCTVPARFAIATGNPMKVRSLEKAATLLCNPLQVEAVHPPAGLPRQPVGWSQVVGGALARAVSASESLGGGGFGVGVEAGPVTVGPLVVEVQVAVVVGPGGRASLGTSQGFMLPSSVEARVLGGVELSEAVDVRRPGDIGEGVGYIGVLTRGTVTRQDLTVSAILMALLPWANGYWDTLPHYSKLQASGLLDNA